MVLVKLRLTLARSPLTDEFMDKSTVPWNCTLHRASWATVNVLLRVVLSRLAGSFPLLAFVLLEKPKIMLERAKQRIFPHLLLNHFTELVTVLVLTVWFVARSRRIVDTAMIRVPLRLAFPFLGLGFFA